mgnify:CR=1 FL=1
MAIGSRASTPALDAEALRKLESSPSVEVDPPRHPATTVPERSTTRWWTNGRPSSSGAETHPMWFAPWTSRALRTFSSPFAAAGHSVAGKALCDDGLVIDLSPMQGILVDPTVALARAEGGLTWGEVRPGDPGLWSGYDGWVHLHHRHRRADPGWVDSGGSCGSTGSRATTCNR